VLRTGRPFSAAQAHEWGLVQELVSLDDLVDRATALCRDLARGTATVHAIPTGPLADVPASLPDIDLRHLSKAVDRVIVAAILDGARTSLREGLAIENRQFGEVCRTEDMKIGIRTFLEKGPRAKAPFVHR
jgi:enoyl-CoA hydratase/carnithine racemase